MTDAELARENSAEAFLALGSAAPAAKVTRGARYCLCASSFKHPLANFAVKLDLDRDSIRELSDYALARPHFRLHVMTGDRPASAAGAFVAAGLSEKYRLSLMARGAGGLPDSRVRIAEPEEVAAVAEFVVGQFFWTTPAAVRRKIARITTIAASKSKQVYLVVDGPVGLDGAATLLTFGESAGLYNVCVRPSARGQGIGAALVVHACQAATTQRVVLQCDPALAGWYHGMGFREVGESVALGAF